MPTTIATETQLLRMLSNTPLQVNITLLHPATYNCTISDHSHLETFYKTFEEVKDQKFDGFIMTGAPVEKLEFDEVHYWPELCKIMDWSKTNVHSTLHICWGAQAGLFYHYGVPKHQFDKKLSGIYMNDICDKLSPLFRGMDDRICMPQSRYTEVRAEDINKVPEIEILAQSEQAGVSIVASKDGRQLFFTGHGEYDRETLHNEYMRDLGKGLDIQPPDNYYPNNDPNNAPELVWRAHASLLYSNWLNYFVYQSTPFNLNEIK